MLRLPTEIRASSKSRFLFLCLEWGLLFAGLATLTTTEEYNALVSVGATLVIAAFVIRGVRTGDLLPRTGLEIAWGLFLFSALFATAIAYNQFTALLQFYRILATCVLFYAVVSSQEILLGWLATGLLFAAVGLAIYWPTQHDFVAAPGKLAIITQAGIWINTHSPMIPGPSIHNNVAAGTLALAVPFGITLLLEAARQRKFSLVIFFTLLNSILIAGLILTSSRGAWFAVGGTALLVALVYLQRRWFIKSKQRNAYWLGVFLLGASFLGIILATGNLDQLLGQIPNPKGTLQTRSQLWAQGFSIVRDYPFTGSGLMTYWMVNALYSMMINVPNVAHAHNTILEVWIEQGMLGFLALLMASVVIVGWTWRALTRGKASVWGWTGLAALTIAGLHGLVDVVFYVERTLPLVGLPLGFAWFLTQSPSVQDQILSVRITPDERRFFRIFVLISLISLIIANHRHLLSLGYSNIGAIIQTRQELNNYDPNTLHLSGLDKVRQASDSDSAQAAFQTALTWKSSNHTSLHRLTQIALSRGEYAKALSTIHQAWDAGHRDEVTRLLYGDALVADGQPEEAAKVVQGLAWAESRLENQAWYRYWLSEDYRRAADAWRAVLILNPENAVAAQWLQQAQSKLR